jgi:hypothetical protein
MTTGELIAANRLSHHAVMATVGDMALQTLQVSFEARVVASFPSTPSYKMHIYRELKKYETARTPSPSN